MGEKVSKTLKESGNSNENKKSHPRMRKYDDSHSLNPSLSFDSLQKMELQISQWNLRELSNTDIYSCLQMSHICALQETGINDLMLKSRKGRFFFNKRTKN